MLKVKADPVGADVNIQRVQTILHSYLLTVWGGSMEANYICYGRTYPVKTLDNGYVAEAYKGKGEYTEAYMDDKYSAVSFFGLDAKSTVELGRIFTGAHLVFFVNLEKVKPNILHRADEEIRKDLVDFFLPNVGGFKLTGIDTRIENVLKEYPGLRREVYVKYLDVHPYHCFRLNFDYAYSMNDC